MPLAVDKFEGIVRRSGYTPLAPVPLQDARDGRVLLAERYRDEAVADDGKTVSFPHFEVLWAVDRDGVSEASTIRFPAWLNSKDGIVYPVPVHSRPEDRVRDTVAHAQSWANACKDVGKY